MKSYTPEHLGIRETSPQQTTNVLDGMDIERPILHYMQQNRAERAQLFRRILFIDKELPPVYPPPGRALPNEFYGQGEK